MKIMIDGKIYTEEDGPMAVHLTEQDRQNIAGMVPGASVYMVYDTAAMTTDQAREFIHNAKVKMTAE